ncbi:pre-rRNA processing protein [Paramarasmius palmivorus]|uniref:Pre-rRNA processing protein n=1 Tax=Paramarasmius palmivorus TaxID=297713 RepID=A0AAW0EBE5_9AGAR
MPDSFFTSQKTRKRKRLKRAALNQASRNLIFPLGKNKNSKPRLPNGTAKRKRNDEELESDNTNDEDGGVDDMDLRVDTEDEHEHSGEEDADETPAEKRLRLAQLYLQGVKEDMGLADGEFDAAEIDKELISARLKQDVMEHSGKLHLFVADSYDFTKPVPSKRFTKGHRLSVTSAVASESGRYLFSAGKEGHIIKWDISTGKQIKAIYKVRPTNTDKKGKGKALDPDAQGHTDEVLALALSFDGKYLVSGGRDRKVVVWDADECKLVKCFVGPTGHKDGISAVSFRVGTPQLYTASFDRTVKVYDLSPNVMGYVETLFGHQDHILALDSLRAETCVTVGARDKTVRFWKIVEETQLVFRGGGISKVREVLEGGLRGENDVDDGDADSKSTSFIEGSLECCAMIDESTFVSGGDSGTISLWTTQKKKPVYKHPLSHGVNETVSEASGVIQTPRWITSLACLRYSDLFASGSWDGSIRLWKVDPKLKSFSLTGSLTLPGVINSLQFVTPPKDLPENIPWIAHSTTPPTQKGSSQPESAKQAPIDNAKPVFLVAGVGQEHRLGRWLNTKTDGAKNETVVFALLPSKQTKRTTSTS